MLLEDVVPLLGVLLGFRWILAGARPPPDIGLVGPVVAEGTALVFGLVCVGVGDPLLVYVDATIQDFQPTKERVEHVGFQQGVVLRNG